ncbi:hypothetical protein [Azotobacter beijerinckii]|uniref:Regulatory protein, luxR family n=1 Tax=Azotobacter beijerinckii TaxID=170623 RepID=A0A1I4G971_9GAMM|nr:hypothetical protein [Azotobacter beijerinckii]SFB46232.1 hypothetical protein SAMN04244571_02986 [Azotobacter beijerinckii]SFL26628.1 hypothetical protein SAMN04244574_03732 [Azotobacter beijerinckii]
MYAEKILGDDVIGLPGQNLTPTELRVLVGLADGHAPSVVAADIHTDASTLRRVEASIKAKLGAKTHPHMVTRGFTLGVLIPRALCLFLALLGALESLDVDGMRQRAPKRSRIASQSRLVKKDSSHGADGTGPLFVQSVGDSGIFAAKHCSMA